MRKVGMTKSTLETHQWLWIPPWRYCRQIVENDGLLQILLDQLARRGIRRTHDDVQDAQADHLAVMSRAIGGPHGVGIIQRAAGFLEAALVGVDIG